jgi:hypothetical protein
VAGCLLPSMCQKIAVAWSTWENETSKRVHLCWKASENENKWIWLHKMTTLTKVTIYYQHSRFDHVSLLSPFAHVILHCPQRNKRRTQRVNIEVLFSHATPLFQKPLSGSHNYTTGSMIGGIIVFSFFI